MLNDPHFLPSLKEVEQFFGPGSKGNAAFQTFCKAHRIYEYPTKEYVNALSDYLADRIRYFAFSEPTPIPILEVCAGDGRLKYFLKQALQQKIPGLFSYTASDSGEWNIGNLSPVELLDHETALEEIQPTIVLCSWMPNNQDLTQDFRDCESVREYILIGNSLECGHPWLTWGEKSHNIPPYKRDGFELKIFGSDFPKQLCMDSKLNSPEQASWTYSFNRFEKNA